MTDDQELAQLLEHGLAVARGHLQKDGETVPVLIVEGNGETAIIAMPWESPDEKRRIMALVGAEAWQRVGAVSRIVLVSDTWVLARERDDPSPWPTGSLEHVPGRYEALLALASNGVGNYEGLMQRYHRRPSGKIRRFDAPETRSEMLESGLIDTFWQGYLLAMQRGAAS